MSETTLFDTPFIAIDYIAVDIPEHFTKDVLQKIILESQGQAISIPKNIPPEIVCVLFPKLYSVADELVFRDQGGYELIFSHQAKNVLRPKNIDTRVWDIVQKIEEPDTNKKRLAKQVLEIEDLWENVTKKTEDEQDRIIIFISSLTSVLKLTQELYIQGKVPIPALLPLLNFVRPYAKDIFYNDIGVFKSKSQ